MPRWTPSLVDVVTAFRSAVMRWRCSALVIVVASCATSEQSVRVCDSPAGHVSGEQSTHPALAIGAVAGGPGSARGWSEAVMALGRRVTELRGGVSSPLAVNVVFQIPGRFLDPEFAGVRTGRFSLKDRRLLVQVALPSEQSPTPDVDVRDFLREAVALAEEFAQKEAMIDSRLDNLRDLVNRL